MQVQHTSQTVGLGGFAVEAPDFFLTDCNILTNDDTTGIKPIIASKGLFFFVLALCSAISRRLLFLVNAWLECVV